MKEKVQIKADIFAETVKRFPHIDMYKFEVLYSGWRRQGIRHGRNAQFFSVAWERGWLSTRDADDFRKYIGLS